MSNNIPTLQNKRAVVFGAGGSIGSSVAREFAAEGATVFLAGRTKSNVEDVARQITKSGGKAYASAIDAEDDGAVRDYVDGIAQYHGGIDIMFNAIGPLAHEYGNGTAAVDLTPEQFMVPLMTIVKSQFITAHAAARHMLRQGSGVIIFLTGSPARGHVEGVTAIGAAFGAVETFMENLAVEVGQRGVRSVCLRITANTDSRTIQQTMDILAKRTKVTKDQLISRLPSNLLKRPMSVSETARAAAFLASDHARMITGTVVNSSAGAAPD